MMENCEEYQFINCLNIFSLTLGPWELPPANVKTQVIDPTNLSLEL